jgi:hypothetical protein
MSTQKPSEAEEEYFARQQADAKRKLAHSRHDQLAQQERDRLKSLHHMKCPSCGLDLEEVIFRGVRIDRCFGCNGTFLDARNFEALAGKGHGFVESVVRIFTEQGNKS